MKSFIYLQKKFLILENRLSEEVKPLNAGKLGE